MQTFTLPCLSLGSVSSGKNDVNIAIRTKVCCMSWVKKRTNASLACTRNSLRAWPEGTNYNRGGQGMCHVPKASHPSIWFPLSFLISAENVLAAWAELVNQCWVQSFPCTITMPCLISLPFNSILYVFANRFWSGSWHACRISHSYLSWDYQPEYLLLHRSGKTLPRCFQSGDTQKVKASR